MLIYGNRYSVLGFEKKEFELTNKGMMQAHLKGNKDYPWKRSVTEYRVRVKMQSESFERTLVFDESEYKRLFPIKKDI
jgi:hypothetical protein